MKRCNGFLRWASLSLFAACLPLAVASQEGYWNIKKYLTDPVPTLKAAVRVLDTATGEVEIYGSDSAQPTIPFTFDWADGQSEVGWFNRRHTYQDLTRNYFPKVTAHYADGSTGEVEMVVLFVAPQLDPQPLPSTVSVTIPDHPVTLTSRVPWGSPPGNLTFFDDSFFPVIPRAAVEYVLTAGATVEEDLINGDHILIDGGFDQVVLLQPGYGGGQGLTWASPLAITSNEYNMQTSPDWSLLFHELRHNFQFNSPADPCFLYFGVDGRGGLFLWEGVARALQVTPAYELLNDSERYGLGREIPICIEEATLVMVKEFRDKYFGYVASGMPFTTYFNDPAVPPDGVEIMACVMATRFWVHAEEQGLGYRVPSKRFMKLVHTFDQESYDRWDSRDDTPEADEYRSTFMVTALSFAFDEDLRAEFRALNFPISDADYEELWQKADTDHADFGLSLTPATLAVPRGRTVTCTIATEAIEGLTHDISFRARMTSPIEGVSVTLSDRSVAPGGAVTVTVTADAGAPLATSSIRLQAEGEYTAHAADIPVTVITVPTIASASYAKKILTIQGSDFGTAPRVLVNGADHTAQVTNASDTSISLRGKKKKLGLQTGENRIVVVDSAGTSSDEFVLNL